MNVLDYFSLNEQPFRIGPDPRYLFYSGQVKDAIAKREYMARDRVGPIYMYGPIGSGKTSILRRVNERLSSDKRYTVAYVISANVRRPNTFLKVIMEAFDVQTARSYDANLKLFESFLIDQYKKKTVPILLLDEAQNANRDALKLLHYLLNFETATEKLLQIVLSGQEELAARILRYRELASRMFPIAINAMTSQDLEEMIRFRWMVAGGKDMPFVEDNPMSVYNVDPCPTCGEANNLRWLDSTPATDTWGCKECGWEWAIEVGSPGQIDTERMERAEING